MNNTERGEPGAVEDWVQRARREHYERMARQAGYDAGGPDSRDTETAHPERPDPDNLSEARPLVKIFVLACVVIAATLAMGYCTPARGQTADTWIAVSLASFHPDRDYARARQLQDITPGIGIEHGSDITLLNTRVRWLAGIQRNSYWHTPHCAGRSVWRCGLSVYGGASWQPVQVYGVHAGIAGGGITAYPIHDGKPSPMLAAMLSIERPTWGGNLVLAPKVADKSHGAVTLQLKWRLA